MSTNRTVLEILGLIPGADVKPSRGRPLIEDKGKTLTALKPWEALGMSRRTWERRRKERSDNAKQ